MITFLCLLQFIVVCINAQNYPFPQNGNIRYKNCIRPDISLQHLNNDVKNAYNNWKKDFLQQSRVNSKQYYIKAMSTGGTQTAITNSEAMGYGMIIVALMAGYDSQARVYFDGLYRMFDTHRSGRNDYLMQWQVQENEVRNSDGSATDGDLDIAYALILAHNQWGSSSGSINYQQAARDMIKYGLEKSYIMSSNRLAMGDFQTSDIYSSRTSDWMFGHFPIFEKYSSSSEKWSTLSRNLYSILDQIQTKYSPQTGLIPDFIVNKDPQPAPPYKPLRDEGEHTGKYGYNACRVPLRVVIAYAHYGHSEAKKIIDKMIDWIKKKTNNQPNRITDGYNLDGSSIQGRSYGAGVFIAPLVAASVANPQNQKWLNDGWNAIKSLKQGYFSDTYNLMSMIFISGNWWIPK